MTDTHPKVLLVDDEPERARMVCEALAADGYKVIAQRTSAQGLMAAVAQYEPDVVIIDMDSPDRDTLDNMAVLSEHAPRPIVFFAGQDSDRPTIQAAVKAGVSAYIVDGFSASRVRPVVDVAIARFEEFQGLRSQLDETRTALEERKIIERAKGLLMKQHGCDEEQAYSTLRRLAMDRSQRMAAVARDVMTILSPEGESASQGDHA
ncbi:ANTAR domain-containing protein [Marinobacteraceae bacterium S3BR75-40.1]